MKIELGTEKLKKAVARVSKGVGGSGIFITTTIIGIEGKDGNVYLTATDRAATITVALKDVIAKDVKFYTNTKAELFKKLIDRTQSATVVLDILEDRIVFSGSGDANLEVLYNDEDGGATPAVIQKPVVEGEPKKVKISDLDKFLAYLKGTLAERTTTPILTNYRVYHNKAVTFNTFGFNLVEIDWDEDIIIPKNVVDLFETLEGDYANITVADNKIKVETDDVEITGPLAGKPEEYPVQRYENMAYSKETFVKHVVVDRLRFVNALDRISLFIDKDNEKDIFNIEIGKDDIVFTTFSKNCVERVVFDSSDSDEVIVTMIGLGVLEAAISTIKSDKIDITFGTRTGIRIHDEADKAYLVIPYVREK